MIESAVVAVVFLVLLTGIVEFARLGFAYNEVSYAAQSAARYAAVRGASSGHPASASEVQEVAESFMAGLDNSNVTVAATWTPDNNPGSTVQVVVHYTFATILLPISRQPFTLTTTARALITQ